jgi:hypothetical protein
LASIRCDIITAVGTLTSRRWEVFSPGHAYPPRSVSLRVRATNLTVSIAASLAAQHGNDVWVGPSTPQRYDLCNSIVAILVERSISATPRSR